MYITFQNSCLQANSWMILNILRFEVHAAQDHHDGERERVISQIHTTGFLGPMGTRVHQQPPTRKLLETNLHT